MQKLSFIDRFIITAVLLIALVISAFQLMAHPIRVAIDIAFRVCASAYSRIANLRS